MEKIKIDKIEEALDDIRNGKVVIVVATIGRAMTMASAAPALQSSRLSASSVRRSATMPAPSAARTTSSPSLRTERARIRLATFEHATMKTKAEAASSTSRMVRAGEMI